MDASLPARTMMRCSVFRSQPKVLASSCRRTASQIRYLHNTDGRSATPIPHAEVHSAPPPPPQPAPSSSEDRLQRRQHQAELLQRGRELRANPSRPATVLRKRFWKHVSVIDTPEGWQIKLDTRPVRTADKEILTIPKSKPQLATAIALEWDLLVSAQQALKQHYIPLTSLVSRAIDIEAADAQHNTKIRDSITSMLVRYLNTDTLLCWAPEVDRHSPMSRENSSESLRELQSKCATPIISYLTSRVWPGVEILPVLETDSILPTPQPAVTQEIVRGWIYGLKPYELAGLERAVLATKSLLVGVRLLVEWSQEFAAIRNAEPAERFGIEDAAVACNLEVAWQTAQWGEVDDTHDVDREDVRRQLGGVVLLVNGETL